MKVRSKLIGELFESFLLGVFVTSLAGGLLLAVLKMIGLVR